MLQPFAPFDGRVKNFNELTIGEYFYTDMWPFFNHDSPILYAIYPLKRAFNDARFLSEVHQGNRGRIHFLYSEMIHVGYVFEIPKTDLIFKTPHFFSSASKAVNWDFISESDITTFMSNSYICVYFYGEDAVLSAKKELLNEVFLP